MDKTYQPDRYEADIYQRWEASGAFAPDMSAPKEPFTIILPPPNANGDLHLGHAMFVVEDIMIRYRRMLGHKTLWLPGTDHAGIETQFMFERQLEKEGKSRFDLGPEEFYAQALAFTQANQHRIINQLRSLGFSADWSRLKFTLEDDIVETVYATFKQLHSDGLIYRGNRIVNWCPSCQAAFADIELDHQEREDNLYELDYGSLKIATTRPETIFADAAVAVHPDDKRFAKLIGQAATIPLIDRPLPIIADNYVDPTFGTGALKITPAHDKNDYEIGRRHELPEIQIVDLEGKLINVPDEFAGLTVDEARKAVVAALEASGQLIRTTPLVHSVAVHDRCGSVIEPLISEQWYVRVQPLIEPTVEAIRSGKITFVPARFKKIALDWLAQEHDWNISRQIWWGIKIPVFYKTSNDPDKDTYLVSWDESEAEAYYGAGNYRAEADTFDTWFSSGQWPFATLQATGDFAQGFYPTSVMETGRDILTKWVTKMIWFGLYRTGQVPFHTVYLHGLVNDAHGRKMSKSKGNGINPLEMTAKYGTDALRLALTIGITPGNDGSLSEEKIQGYRNFCNKLWNVARFILGQLPDDYSPALPAAKTAADEWILVKLNNAVIDVTKALEDYRFSEAGQITYSLLWDDFADWYVEAAKTGPNADLLVYGLETILKLVHPLAPFVSETIWSRLPWQSGQLITASWPEVNKKRTQNTVFQDVIEVVTSARTMQAELGLQQIEIVYAPTDFWRANGALIGRLLSGAALREGNSSQGLLLAGRHTAWLEANRKALDQTLGRLKKSQEEKGKYLKGLEAQLKNENYLKSAPESVVADTRRRHEEALMLLSKLDEQIRALSA